MKKPKYDYRKLESFLLKVLRKHRKIRVLTRSLGNPGTVKTRIITKRDKNLIDTNSSVYANGDEPANHFWHFHTSCFSSPKTDRDIRALIRAMNSYDRQRSWQISSVFVGPGLKTRVSFNKVMGIKPKKKTKKKATKKRTNYAIAA